MNPNGATEDNIQDQNLVNDQITAAIDKLSETASDAVATAAPVDEPAQDAAQPAPAPEPQPAPAAPAPELPKEEPAPAQPIVEEHEEVSADPPAPVEESHEEDNSIGSINIGSLPIDEHSEPTDQAVPPPAITGSDVSASVPVQVAHDEPAAAPSISITSEPEAPTAPTKPATINVKDASNDMDYLRSRTLKELAPIVDNLDVSQEQKYRTVMDTYEATKDSQLLQQAFDFASVIPDDKRKAEALQAILDKIH